jgi:hypothetical protein
MNTSDEKISLFDLMKCAINSIEGQEKKNTNPVPGAKSPELSTTRRPEHTSPSLFVSHSAGHRDTAFSDLSTPFTQNDNVSDDSSQQDNATDSLTDTESKVNLTQEFRSAFGLKSKPLSRQEKEEQLTRQRYQRLARLGKKQGD